MADWINNDLHFLCKCNEYCMFKLSCVYNTLHLVGHISTAVYGGMIIPCPLPFRQTILASANQIND